MRRTLRLAKETLTRLDNAELASVAGGASRIPCMYECNYTYCPECINDWTFEFCPTPTIPVELCV
jgi:hypothetical protein